MASLQPPFMALLRIAATQSAVNAGICSNKGGEIFPHQWHISGMTDLALYQPDIAGNTGTLVRLAACTSTTLHIIAPTGFRMDDTALRRAGMDYLDLAAIVRHVDWRAFSIWRMEQRRRLILMTTRAAEPLWNFSFLGSDIILLGRESAGVPHDVHATCDARLTIPMAEGARSLNLAVAGAMALGEAIRQGRSPDQSAVG